MAGYYGRLVQAQEWMNRVGLVCVGRYTIAGPGDLLSSPGPSTVSGAAIRYEEPSVFPFLPAALFLL